MVDADMDHKTARDKVLQLAYLCNWQSTSTTKRQPKGNLCKSKFGELLQRHQRTLTAQLPQHKFFLDDCFPAF